MVEVTKFQMIQMKDWLKEHRIAFEFTRIDYSLSIEIKLVDYKHNCCIVSKEYPYRKLKSGYVETIRRIVRKFEEEEVYPLLFDEYKIRGKEEQINESRLRLIRED